MRFDKAVSDTVFSVLSAHDVRQATFFWSPTEIIRVTRIWRTTRRAEQESFVLTIGRPNFAERLAVKALRKAKEPFPVKKVQLKFWPKR